MKIVHLFHSFQASGPELLVLPALSRLELDVTVLVLDETRKPSAENQTVKLCKELGLEVKEIAVRSRLDFSAIRLLSSTIAEIAPDIVHAHDVKASSYLFFTQFIGGKNKSCSTYRSFSTHHGVRGRSGLMNRLYESFYAKVVLPRFDRALAVCSSDCQILRDRGLQAHLHRNGVSRPAESRDSRTKKKSELCSLLRSRYGLRVSDDTTLFATVGRLSAEKKCERVLYAASELRDLGVNDFKIIIVGDGRERSFLEREVARLGLDEHVSLLGHIPQFFRLLAGVDVLISCSFAEGMPINLLEAAWARTAIIANAIDGNVELIRAGQDGALISAQARAPEMADAMLSMFESSRRTAYSESLFLRVSNEFSEENWLARLLDLYSESLSGDFSKNALCNNITAFQAGSVGPSA